VRNFSPWQQWVTRLAGTTHEDPFPEHDVAAMAPWRERRRARFLELLGSFPDPVPLAPETLETVQSGGYRRERIVFDSEDGMSVPAYLLIPDARSDPGPAVLGIHGHGPGKSHVCGLAETAQPNADYGRQLVRRGYVVLAPDLRCFGERVDEGPDDHYACDTNLVHAVMAGSVPLAQNLWDLARALDMLERHPLVDPDRLGVVGFSYGGTMALFLAAYDNRVAAAVVSGYLSSWAASHAIPFNTCGSQVLPGVLGRLEHLDVASLVAPRPMLVESGTEDPIFPAGVARKTVAQLRAVYAALGAEDHLYHDVFAGGHQWHGDMAYPFLDRFLREEQPAPSG
jgi:dienelactone hydrolase